MNNPNIPKKIIEKSRWLAAVGLGFLALGVVVSGNEERANNPGSVLNLSANPYHLTDAERGELIEAREEACGGVFAPESCWDFSGLNSNLYSTSLIKFTPIIPISDTESITNDSFTVVPTYVDAKK